MNRVSATSELAQQKDRNKQDLHLQLFSLFEERKKHSRLSGGGFLASSLPERVRDEKKSDNKVWSKGNFLTGSNSFVLKENKTLDQC